MRLAKREKYSLIVGCCLIAAFFAIQFLVGPFFEERNRLQKGIRVKEASLQEIIELAQEYKSLQAGSHRIKRLLAAREKGFTLFTFLERAASDARIKDHIKYMKPSVIRGTGPAAESIVEMKLERITLNQLVGYLHRIELPDKAIAVKRISIKENTRDKGYLEAVLQAVTYR